MSGTRKKEVGKLTGSLAWLGTEIQSLSFACKKTGGRARVKCVPRLFLGTMKTRKKLLFTKSACCQN
jgi:hypothetical protein